MIIKQLIRYYKTDISYNAIIKEHITKKQRKQYCSTLRSINIVSVIFGLIVSAPFIVYRYYGFYWALLIGALVGLIFFIDFRILILQKDPKKKYRGLILSRLINKKNNIEDVATNKLKEKYSINTQVSKSNAIFFVQKYKLGVFLKERNLKEDYKFILNALRHKDIIYIPMLVGFLLCMASLIIPIIFKTLKLIENLLLTKYPDSANYIYIFSLSIFITILCCILIAWIVFSIKEHFNNLFYRNNGLRILIENICLSKNPEK